MVACCILHNLCIDYGEYVQPDEVEEPIENAAEILPNGAANLAGLAFRNAFINQHFQ